MVQRWQPDTCKCVLLEEYNPITDTKTVVGFENVCNIHSNIVNDHQRYDTLVGHNSRKNGIYNEVLKQFPAILTELDSNGNTVLKKNITFNQSYSGTGDNAVLNISFAGISLNTQQKNTIQNIANTLFGSGKVVVS